MNISPNAQLKIQMGKDGNPKIYACGTEMEQKALCAALIAGICIDQRNPEALLSIVTTAADLMDRMEESPMKIKSASGTGWLRQRYRKSAVRNGHRGRCTAGQLHL